MIINFSLRRVQAVLATATKVILTTATEAVLATATEGGPGFNGGEASGMARTTSYPPPHT